MQTPVFQVIAALVVVFVVLGYFSQSASSKENSAQFHDRAGTTTLNQNLAHLKSLTQAEDLKNREIMQQRIIDAQRHVPNYTSTPDGKKIGNPAAFRDAPQKIKMSRELKARMNAPTTFVNVEYANPISVDAQSYASKNEGDAAIPADNAVGFAKATHLAHPEFTIAAGELIEATLETAINSQLSGMVRAITTRDVYSLNADNRLIPKGSRLIGQYASSGIGQTQTRVLISWTRVQLPDGIVATLNSPSTDSLGRAGLRANDIDTHFMERFGASVLFSVLGAYTANAGVNGLDGYNSASQYRMGLVQSFQKSSSDLVNQNANIPPTLKINQGNKINVFVARDLSFYEVLNQGGVA